jgi:hypothetical protein
LVSNISYISTTTLFILFIYWILLCQTSFEQGGDVVIFMIMGILLGWLLAWLVAYALLQLSISSGGRLSYYLLFDP